MKAAGRVSGLVVLDHQAREPVDHQPRNLPVRYPVAVPQMVGIVVETAVRSGPAAPGSVGVAPTVVTGIGPSQARLTTAAAAIPSSELVMVTAPMADLSAPPLRPCRGGREPDDEQREECAQGQSPEPSLMTLHGIPL